MWAMTGARCRESRATRELLELPSDPGWLNQVHGTAVADLDSYPQGVITADAAVARTRRPRLRGHGGRLPTRAVLLTAMGSASPPRMRAGAGSLPVCSSRRWPRWVCAATYSVHGWTCDLEGALRSGRGSARRVCRCRTGAANSRSAECARAMAGGSRRPGAPPAGGTGRHRCQRRAMVHLRGSRALLFASTRWEGRPHGRAHLAPLTCVLGSSRFDQPPLDHPRHHGFGCAVRARGRHFPGVARARA